MICWCFLGNVITDQRGWACTTKIHVQNFTGTLRWLKEVVILTAKWLHHHHSTDFRSQYLFKLTGKYVANASIEVSPWCLYPIGGYGRWDGLLLLIPTSDWVQVPSDATTTRKIPVKFMKSRKQWVSMVADWPYTPKILQLQTIKKRRYF